MRFLIAIALSALPMGAAVICGSVKDASGRAVQNATVSVKGQASPIQTDLKGNYRFASVPQGSYSVHAAAGGIDAVSAPFNLGAGETKQVDLVLQPEFFDEPKFTVAGVTAGNYQGGHGSDVVLRSADELRKELNAKPLPSESAEYFRRAIAQDPGNAELHRKLAEADEGAGRSLEAAGEYQEAAELDPSERNIFDWGAELLSHRADTQATEVFTRGHQLHPQSGRMLLGLAAACYARGSYDEAAKYFYAASDLNPSDPTPYLLLGKVHGSAITQTAAFVEKMKRFADLHPEDAQANYLYAASIWSNRAGNEDARKAEALLRKAVQLKPDLSAAYLELGIVLADVKQFPKAIESLRRADDLDEAHYRLAQIYRLMGQPMQAAQELRTYNERSAKSANEAQQERREVQQFVFALRSQ